MKTLTEIANELGCDKGTTAHEQHGYTEVYQDLVPLDAHLLEIGIYRGQSLRMWREFSNRIRLVAIDNDPTTLTPEVRSICTAWLADQSNKKNLQTISDGYDCDKFEVIIDDGSHRPDDQLLSLQTLWPCLKPNGSYFIEDLHARQFFPEQLDPLPRIEAFASSIGMRVEYFCDNKLARIFA